MPHSPPRTPDQLAALRAQYTVAPDDAHELVDPVGQALQPLLKAEAGDDFGIELGLFFVDLCLEARRQAEAWPLLPQLLSWCQAGAAPQRLPLLQALHGRALVALGRLDEALPELDRAQQLAAGAKDALALGHVRLALGQMAARQGDDEGAQANLRDALDLFKRSGDGGPWAQIYSSLGVVMRKTASLEARHTLIELGKQTLMAQRRWSEVANLSLEQVDLALDAGQLEQAGNLLKQARQLSQTLPPQSPIACMVQLAHCNLLFAQGQQQAAIEQMQAWLDALRPVLPAQDQAYFLARLAHWQAKAGHAELALATLTESHRLERRTLEKHNERDLNLSRQRMELAHEQQGRRQSEAHAEELARGNARLQQALDELQLAQRQLLDAAKHAALGRMLAGMAHEINTPVGNAITAASTLQDLADSLLGALAGGQLRRSELQQQLDSMQQATRLVVRNLDRSSQLLAGFRELPSLNRRVLHAAVDLQGLVRSAWSRAQTAELDLRLDLQPPTEAWVDGEALIDVLMQLFQNIGRHAYRQPLTGPQPVHVAVRHPAPDRLEIELRDEGEGVPEALLPFLFEPYATSQFGRGRSGLGLFVARAIVEQRLNGRIELQNLPEGGCCVRLDLPVRRA